MADTYVTGGRSTAIAGRKPVSFGRLVCLTICLMAASAASAQSQFGGFAADSRVGQFVPPDIDDPDGDGQPLVPAFPARRSAPPTIHRDAPAPRCTSAECRSACDAMIEIAETELKIPPNVLKAIGLVEAGQKNGSVYPFAANIAGRTVIYGNLAQAVAGVRAAQRNGIRSIDVGCLQVNLHHHPDAFASLEEAFDPVVNVAYGAAFLVSLKRQYGTWTRAAQRYHGSDHAAQRQYLCQVLGKFDTLSPSEQTRRDLARLCHK